MSDSTPPVFGDRYQLVRHIARGGMAQVYLGRDLMLDRLVALKVLFPELSVDRKFVERFRREARAAANLTHPNIVSIYDWGQGDHTYYIVMEYVDGHTLSSRIRQGPIPPLEAAAIASSVAAALSFAHRHDVIHRDVKPGNVLIDKSGAVKVTDFGIARAVGTAENLTQAGSVMGTATYFSPEQAQGQTVDARSDVYSLGIVLYEMSVGHPPFQGDNPVAIAYKHVREAPDAPTTRNRAIPPAYEAIVLKAMAKDPVDRYQSAEELRADLESFRSGRPVAAAAVAGAASATAVMAGGLAADVGPPTLAVRSVDSTTVIGGNVPPPRGPETAEPTGGDSEAGHDGTRAGHAVRWISLLVVLLAVLAVAGFFFGRHEGWFDSGTKTLTVPKIAGQSEAKAQALLRAEGFTDVVTMPVTNASVQLGIVVGTKPVAGSNLVPSARLVLDVSAGPFLVAVPPVGNKTEQSAVTALKDKGFTSSIRFRTSATVPKGYVINTDPAAGAKKAKGTKVTIFVSKGHAPIDVPSVLRDTPTQAALLLAGDGFKPVQGPNQASATVPSGLVTGTNPPASSSEPYGSKVTIFVSNGPATVTVPSVIGKTQSNAAAILSQHHLKYHFMTVPVSEKAQNGRVQSTNPAPGISVNQGTIVQVEIGTYTAPTTTTSTTTTTTTTLPPPSTTTTTVAPVSREPAELKDDRGYTGGATFPV